MNISQVTTDGTTQIENENGIATNPSPKEKWGAIYRDISNRVKALAKELDVEVTVELEDTGRYYKLHVNDKEYTQKGYRGENINLPKITEDLKNE